MKTKLKMMHKKRGQITVFIIIGALVLLTYFLLSYYKTEKLEETKLIMPELIPVQQFVQACTEGLARKAIDIIGVNGGYITFPPWIANNPNSYLQLTPVEDLRNPYWRYDNKEAIPPIDFMEKQISDYTEAGMARCLDNFSAFGDVYTILKLDDFNVITEIDEEDITVKTIYPIEVRDKFNKTLAELQKFPVTIPIRLKKVHELAENIMQRENKDYFIEEKAIDLISLDDKNIPTTGMEIRCGKKRWEVQKIENKLKTLLDVNLPFIKIKGTGFEEGSMIAPYQLQDINPYSQSNLYNESYYYYHYIWDISEIERPNMHVSFSYEQNWPMELEVRPNKGLYIESNPQRAGKILSLFCFHIWHFTYDVIFPVKTTIVDDKTENNERYSFNFFFEAQINHNKPDRTNLASETFEARDTYLEEEYCADVTNEITLFAVDQKTNNKIRDVNLSLTCGRYTCNIGKTRSYWDEDPSGIPKLKQRVPYCSNAVISGVKQGYEDSITHIQTGRRLDTPPDERIGNSFTLDMRPIKEFNYTVVKHRLLPQGISGPSPLTEDEKAIITINLKEENLEEEEFESYGTYPIDFMAPLRLLGKDDFKYDLEIFMMDNQSINGGYTGEWNVRWSDPSKPGDIPLKFGKNITFHIITEDLETDEERFRFMAQLNTNSKKVPLPDIK